MVLALEDTAVRLDGGSSARERNMMRFDGTGRMRWTAVASVTVFAIAIAVRAWHLQTWGMWEDEEGSLRLSQTPYQGFAGYFPIYFLYLNLQTSFTGISVGASRLFPALMGIASVGLTLFLFRRFCRPEVALIGAGLIALNLGHVFLSQSIRYYTLALVFQVLAISCFLEGHERRRVMTCLCSFGFWILALLTHFSSLLLGPAYLAFLALVLLRRDWRERYGAGRCLMSFTLVSGILMLFTWRMLELRGMIGGWVIPSQRDPFHVATTVLAYFGVPVLVLAAAAPWASEGLSPRVLSCWLCAGFLPLLELLVIAALNSVNVTWYYALISLVPCALLAGSTLAGLWHRRLRRIATVLGLGTAAYYAAFLTAYHVDWYGDRPRWSEAAEFVQSVRADEPEPDTSTVYSNVPEVIAFYLGADPRDLESYKSVKRLPASPPLGTEPIWVVIEANVITPAYRSWLERTCDLLATFPAHTGPVNRSVFVYRSGGSIASGVRAASRSKNGSLSGAQVVEPRP